MHPIETPDKTFHDGDGVSELGTILPAWWLNQIQAELLAVLTAAGIRPNKAKTNQLADAIKQIFSGAVVNNLTSADADKPLSAAMGKKLAEQSVVYQSWATEQIAGKANKSSTRAGYGITDASEVAVARFTTRPATFLAMGSSPVMASLMVSSTFAARADPIPPWGCGPFACLPDQT